jgi:RNA polymerase sigma-70 factor (ECF subfamily)
MGIKTDWEIVHYCRRYGKRYFDTIVRRYFPLVLNICYRFLGDAETAEDAAQDIFLKAYEGLGSAQDRGQPFRNWLCRIASNHCRNLLKRTRRGWEIVNSGQADFWYENSPFEVPGNPGLERREEIKLVNRALSAVPFKERAVLVLHSIAELGVPEIAEILHKPEYTIRRRLRKAKERLKKCVLHFSLADNER